MVTMKEVAKQAGVSTSTVSRVLSGQRAASPETAERIWRVVRETGYSVSEAARSLRSSEPAIKTAVTAIDCVFARDSGGAVDPFFTALLRVIEPELFRADHRLRHQYALTESAIPLPPDSAKKDAALILGRIDRAGLDRLRCHYRHLIYVGLQDRETGIDSVICSSYDAAVTGMEYLLSLGHRRICYLGETKNEQRYLACRDVMEKHRVEGCELVTVGVRFTTGDSYAGIQKALKDGHEFTAVFCANDISTLAVLRALREQRLAVPGDISLLGLNDMESVRYLEPMPSTVRVPIEEMGRMAAKLLLDRIEGGHRLPVRLLLPSELVLRDSCCPPRNS